LTKLSSHLNTKRAVIESLVDMGDRCEEMVKLSLDAFAERDVERARSLHALDELVDRANRQVFVEVLGYVHDPEALEWGMRQITVARCFERIGDNAVDIGEQTAFLVTGEFAEFTDASH
jgi:phosphate transport system protein